MYGKIYWLTVKKCSDCYAKLCFELVLVLKFMPVNVLKFQTGQTFTKMFTMHERPLTDGEKALVLSVFQNEIDLSRPKIIASRWVLKGYAISPNGNIYFNPADYLADFSVSNLGKQSWFIHEMTHVWQVQRGMKIVRKALFDRRYKYLLKTGKSFFAYGIEQQAQMVQDFFIQRSLGQDCQALGACLPFLKPDIQTENLTANQAN